MTKYREILRLKSLGFSDRNIARSCSVSRNTVRRVIDKATEMDISWPLDFGMTDGALEELLFPSDKSATDRRLPDYNYIRKELLRNGVTKKLLWIEYCEECRQAGEEPLMYSQFCEYIRRDEQKRRATMHIPRRPGEQIEVDWAGDPAHIIDPDTGELTDCWLFVGVMTYSQYTFVEAFMNERTGNWIKAHVHMFEFFGGTAPMIVADNCTTAVDHKKSDWYTPVLNTTYHEMAEHYNVAILPARVRRPKDKPNVEGSVGKISTWITAALRNEQFFSLAGLNAAIRKKLDAYNARQFQKKECSRRSLFLGEEQPLLAPLPATPFELAEWKIATVQFNYHIAVDGMFYSVPHQYIKDKVDVRVTDTTIEIFIITIGLLPIVAFTAGAASIPRSRRTCPMTTRNIWSGTAIVSAGGRIRSGQTHERRLMQSLPPAGSNSSHTGAVWGCCGWQTSILPSGLKKPVSVHCPTVANPATKVSKISSLL